MREFVIFSKEFLSYKISTFSKKRISRDFNEAVFKKKLMSAEVLTLEDIHPICNEVASKGLKQISVPFYALKHFSCFLDINKKVLADVDISLIENYINIYCLKKNVSEGVRKNYKNIILSFLDFIDKSKMYKKEFNIKTINMETKKIDSKSDNINWLDAKDIKKICEDISNYKTSNIFARNRDILIFKILLFAGILPNELLDLKADDFQVKEDSMILKIKGLNAKKRNIPLPKNKIYEEYINYLNHRDKKAQFFFYSPKDLKNRISINIVINTTKRILEFCNIEIEDKTPKMLRKSYAIFLSNEKSTKTGFTQSERDILYLLGIGNISALRILIKTNLSRTETSADAFEIL